ncbi:hypothetical protein QFZ99_006106 [Paraburkholderia atlantica]|uniref:hypothetical protein n=1 Tax=Paraburkholderia atlantica TaxID=2654982 RepID=UPI003D21958C
MSSDVTIHISVGSDGAVTSRGTSQSGAAAELPVPLSLADLQASGVGIAPAPLAPAELSAATATTAAQAGGTAPAPMAIEQLISSSALSAPTPQALGALAGRGGGEPVPRPSEDIGGEGQDVPQPIALAELGSPAGGKQR